MASSQPSQRGEESEFCWVMGKGGGNWDLWIINGEL
jgi:hypothetical protein